MDIALRWRMHGEEHARVFSHDDDHDGVVIGRDPSATTIAIPLQSISKQHCRIMVIPDGWAIEDAGSRNGTFLDGKRLGSKPLPLHPGSTIVLGGADECIIEVVKIGGVGAVAAATAQVGNQTKPCPACGEVIKDAAKKCKHCGEYLDADMARQNAFAVLSDGIPLADEPKKPTNLSACPQCGTVMGAGAVLCINCGYDFRTGHRVVASPDPPSLMSYSSHRAGPGVRCQTCGTGSLIRTRKYRLSAPVVVIGYILLMPSIGGIFLSILSLCCHAGGAMDASSQGQKEVGGILLLGGGIAICSGVGFFVSGLLGWLLVMRKSVLQCQNCGATVAAS